MGGLETKGGYAPPGLRIFVFISRFVRPSSLFLSSVFGLPLLASSIYCPMRPPPCPLVSRLLFHCFMLLFSFVFLLCFLSGVSCSPCLASSIYCPVCPAPCVLPSVPPSRVSYPVSHPCVFPCLLFSCLPVLVQCLLSPVLPPPVSSLLYPLPTAPCSCLLSLISCLLFPCRTCWP